MALAAATAFAACEATAGGGGIGGGGAGGPGTGSGQARYGQAELQRDLDAIRDAGAVGVLAEVNGTARLQGSSGKADLDRGGAVSVDNHFRAGSVTKTFISVVVLQLVAENRLSLQDTVDRWLPNVVTGNGNDGRLITVQQLLQHTSGLHNYADDIAAEVTSVEAYDRIRFTTFTPEELLAAALKSAPDFAPGAGWNYSNTNYILLGMIIERATGQDWAAEVDARILQPLDLQETYAPGTGTELTEPHSSAYLYLDAETPVETSQQNMTWAGAAGSLVSTAADLSRFWRAVGRGELVSPPLQEEMRRTVLATSWQEDEPGSRYGLGIVSKPLSCGGIYWRHDGDVPGYTTVSGVSDDGGTTAVISMNVTADTPVHQAAWTMVDHVMCTSA